jgi:hypothetical protein
MPRKKTSTQLMAAMRKEFHRGYQSIFRLLSGGRKGQSVS